MFNRRRRTAYLDEQHAIYTQRVIEAIETEKSGMPLAEDQIIVMNRERARVEAEERAKERSWRKMIKGVFTGGLMGDKEGGEEAVVPSEEEILKTIGVNEMSILKRAAQAGNNSGVQTADLGDRREEGSRDGSGILQAVADKRREGERAMEATGVKGGPLDRIAAGAVQGVGGKAHAAEEKGGSKGGWNNWWAGK